MKFRAIFALSLVCAACAGPPLAAQTPAIWIDVPFVPQVRDGCGSAAISMVLQYWANRNGQASPDFADPQKIQAALFSPAEGGISSNRMEAFFQESGYRTFAFRGEWSDLQHHLEQGRPLIVSLKGSGQFGPLHYAVVVGIDSQRDYLFVNDPAQRKMLRISRQGFESEWSPAHHWALLAVPRTYN
ncbi:MAG TPA: C39 family peptidase [Candidatus Acidoferrales bacterium]|jgi:ABC-type bacteriocin/lantibiotic exporter with double-glycine peptidase domain|nr:C39 family peptidase [Candidatus Acidoferrales bacterium]